jgi:hypothetical protein
MTRTKNWPARQREAEYRTGKIHFPNGDRMTAEAKADAERRLAEIPPDTRDLTARLMGDPLPGRRSIDRKPQGSEDQRK